LPGGILLIDKPKGITSHDVVARVRRELKTKNVGHAGTLDPLASGLLVVGVDSGTKLLSQLFGLDKQYLATIRLGEATTTDDAEGAITFQSDAFQITEKQIQAEIAKLNGEIFQVPSSVSAIKLGGRKAYDIVRAGNEVELKPRQVKIHRFEMISEIIRVGKVIEFDVVVDCSTGTYIRALARDVGNALGVGGHIRELRRTMVGEFIIDDAKPIDNLGQPMNLLSVASLLFPIVKLTDQSATDIVHGKKISLDATGKVAASFNGNLIAILEPAGKFYRSVIVFPEVMNG
jgi:tRNA pseudouridine55 synthase